MSAGANGQQGATIALSRVESALVQLAHDVRAAELARVDADFYARLAVLRTEHGVPPTAPVHVLQHPQVPGAWLLFVPGMSGPVEAAAARATRPARPAFGDVRNGSAPVDDAEAAALERLRLGMYGATAGDENEDTGPSGDEMMADLAASGVQLGGGD